MFDSKNKTTEVIIFKTLNGLITVNIHKSGKGLVELSIKAPRDVMIYREDVSVGTCTGVR